ncbi:sensor histidine kinase, partial [Clostridium sp. AL.422]|nr:sensor histidine kinase [Clostridium sp. AL.422]
MINEKLHYRNKGIISQISIPIILILTILKYFYNMNNEFIFIIRILSISISVLIFFMSIIKAGNGNLGVLKLIGIGFFPIAILRFSGVDISYIISNYEIVIIFIQILNCIEFSNIILSMIIYNKKYPEKIQWIVFIIITFIMILLMKDGYKG